METKKKERFGKREIVHVMSLYLQNHYRKMNMEYVITPVLNAFLASVNSLLERGYEINLRGFGNFIIKDIKKDKCIIGGKEYPIKKKRKVVFKYLNRKFN